MIKKTLKNIGSYLSFVFRTIKDFLRTSPGKTTFILLFSIIAPLMTLVELKLLEKITNGVSGTKTQRDLLFTLLLFLSMLLLTRIISWVYSLIEVKFRSQITIQKQKELYKKIGQIKYDYFEDSDLYNNIWLANRAPGGFTDAIDHIAYLIRTIAQLIIFGVLIANVHILFVLGFVLAFIVSLLLNKKSLTKWDDYYDEYIIPHQRRSLYFESILSDRINHQTIQSNRQLPYFAKEYEVYSDNERKYTLKMNILSFFVEMSFSLFYVIVMLLTLIYVAYNIVAGEFEIGKFAMIAALTFKLMSTFGGLISFIFSNKEYIKIINSYNLILSLDNQSPAYVPTEGSIPADKKLIEMNDISYKYRQSEIMALNSLNCQLKNGSKVSLVGENGSGKTTLMMILLGMLSEYQGSLSNKIGRPTIIMQDFQFYQMSIRENVELGCGGKKIPDDELKDILTQVDLWSHIEKLPNGVDTIIGQLEDGIMLSKGQFQRLAIARMLANKEADIWVLDEPTAFLDPIAEIDMYNYILSLAGDRLVVFISHRLGFSRKADTIIVMKEGSIVETGTHDDLMNLDNGIYRNMFTLQKSWYYD